MNATTGVHLSGSTLTFDSTFNAAAGFSFTLPTVNDTLVEGNESYSVALSAPATNAATASVALGTASVTTTIIDSGTQAFSITEGNTTVSEGSADSYTVHLSNPIDAGVTVSVNLAITLPGGLGGAEAADFTNAFLADVQTAVNATTGVHLSGSTLTFDSTFNTSAGFSFTLPTVNDTLVEGNESYSVALSAPATNAAGANVALGTASVTTTIIDNDTQTFSLTEGNPTVSEGSADSYTVHLTNPIDPGVTVSVNIAITLPSGLGGAEAADFTNAFLADIQTAVNATTGVHLVGSTLTFNSTFNAAAGFSFTLPTVNDTLVEGNESYSVALSAPTSNTATASVAIGAGAGSVTTTIIDNDTQTFSLTEGNPTVSEGSADSYTVHLSNPIDPGVTVSVNIAITLPGGLGGAEAADFTNAFLADVQTAVNATTGVHLSGSTLTFDSTFNAAAGFSFTLPTVNDTLVEGNESYSVALSAPATNAAGANVALGTASVTTTIIDNDTQTFSLTEGNPTVSEGSADSYTVHLSNPIDPGVTVSVNIAITLPSGLGGAEAADFTNAFLADIDTAIASTTGVTRSGTTLTFDSTFNAAAGFSFTLPTVNDTLVEGNESYSVALSAPATNTATANVALGTASVTTTIIDNDTQTFSLTEGNPTVSEGSADSYTVHLTNPIDPGVTVSVNIAITLPGGLGGAEAADFTNAFLADIDTAIASTTGVTRSGTTLTFNSTFNAAAGFSFTLPTVNDTLVEGNESYSVALSAPTSNTATASVAIGAGAGSVTTTIIDNDTQTFSLTEGSTTVSEGSADSYTVHLTNPIDPGVTVSVNIAITLPGGLGGASAADFTNAFLADIQTAVNATTGVHLSGSTLTFDSTFNAAAGFSFTLPTVNDTLVEGNESYSVALSAPATNAATASVALGTASVTTTIIDSGTQAFSITEDNATVTEGSADSYTVHLSNPIDAGVTVSVNLAITLPGGLGGAEAADFTNAFLADVQTAVNATTGVHLSGSTLTFELNLQHQRRLQLHPADRQRHLGRGQRELQRGAVCAGHKRGRRQRGARHRQRHHHHHRQRHADLLAHRRQPDRQRGQRRQLHRPSHQPDRSRRHRQRQHRHHPAERARRRRGGGFHQCLPGRH